MSQKYNFKSINLANIPLFEFNRIIKKWNIDFLQIDPGLFSADLSQIIWEDFQLGYARFNAAIKQEGASPEGVWTFAFVNEVKIFWRNYVIEPSSIIIYAPGSEINAISDANFEVMTFSISDDFLTEMAKKEGLEEIYFSLKTIDVFISKKPLWEKLRKEIFNKIDNYLQNPNCKSGQIFQEVFTKKILTLLKDSEISTKKVSGKKRLKLLHDFEQYILQHITEPITVSNIATYLNVSERTLLYACKNRFGMGPKKYMQVLKLNQANYLLHEENDTKTVSSIARSCGFWHMGQFYKDYKAFFGELPLVTLKKNILKNKLS